MKAGRRCELERATVCLAVNKLGQDASKTPFEQSNGDDYIQFQVLRQERCDFSLVCLMGWASVCEHRDEGSDNDVAKGSDAKRKEEYSIIFRDIKVVENGCRGCWKQCSDEYVQGLEFWSGRLTMRVCGGGRRYSAY